MAGLVKNPVTVARRLWSTLRGVNAIRAMVWDPELSRTYYPEHRRKSGLAILRDLLWWHLRYGEVNKYYYLYGLDRRDADEGAVMPYSWFRAMRNARNLRPAGLSDYYGTSYNFVCVLRDKFIFSQVGRSLGFPVSKPWAILAPDAMLWIESGERLPLERLVADSALEIDGIAKPIDGIHGGAVFPLKVAAGALSIDHRLASLDELRQRITRRYLLETRLTQHPALARLHPHSVNTLRLVTFNRDGEVELFSAAFRVGTGGSITDNWSAGGILLSVDPERGTLRGDGFMKPAFGRRVSRHPDTDVAFEGIAVPHFDRAVDVVRRFHAYLPGIHSIGWDVGIAPDGPVLIEANDDWDGAVPMIVDRDFRRRYTAMF